MFNKNLYWNKLVSLIESDNRLNTLQKEPEEKITEVQPTVVRTDIEGPSTLEEKFGNEVITKNGMPVDMLSGSEEESCSDSTDDSDDSGKEDGK